MGSKKKKAAKVYPSYSNTRTPRDLSIARDLEGLRRADPIEWRDRILDAVREKKGNAVQAAELLGVGHRTIVRWMAADASLRSAIEKIRNSARAERESGKGKAAEA